MVDFSDKSIKTMKKNIEKLKCTENCRIYKKRASAYIKKCDEKYDIILLDPPYNKNMVNETISLIFEYQLLKPNGKIIIEHSSHEKISQEWQEKLCFSKKNGETTISMLA